MKPDVCRVIAFYTEINTVEDTASESYRILVLDGCTDRCATKKLNET
jgi:uncharacterized metal-binding protein